MNRILLTLLAYLAWTCPVAAQPEEVPRPNTHAGTPSSQPAKVFVIPVQEQIGKPALYVLRRGLKEAIEQKVDTVVLDMKTPGGRLDITLEMMEALDKFPGKTVTYVNDEATSAGAIIAAVTDEIHFSPKATIGSAEAIDGTGQDLSDALKRKLNSYMGAKIRAYSGDKGYRADVIRAMMESDFEFKIGDKTIKPEGVLLNLTATEAMASYGQPPLPLLGSGIAESLTALIATLHGPGAVVTKLEVTWSEKAAQFLSAITPLLLGLGMLALFIEFKTPGFGVFGITGLVLMAVVFLGQYVAGLSGHEPVLFFLLGTLLVIAELLLFPGMLIGVLPGAALMFGSLVWAMLDHWPNEPLPITGGALTLPLVQVLGGFVIALALFFALLRFLPKRGPFANMVLQTAVAGVPAIGTPLTASSDAPRGQRLVGLHGRATTSLFPSGQVEIDGHRYEARLETGFADPGTPVTVTKTAEFGLIVEVRKS